MKNTEKTKKEPLFHIIKRDTISTKNKVFFYAGAMLAGLIPASSAAKKDPVVALRTE